MANIVSIHNVSENDSWFLQEVMSQLPFPPTLSNAFHMAGCMATIKCHCQKDLWNLISWGCWSTASAQRCWKNLLYYTTADKTIWMYGIRSLRLCSIIGVWMTYSFETLSDYFLMKKVKRCDRFLFWMKEISKTEVNFFFHCVPLQLGTKWPTDCHRSPDQGLGTPQNQCRSMWAVTEQGQNASPGVVLFFFLFYFFIWFCCCPTL